MAMASTAGRNARPPMASKPPSVWRDYGRLCQMAPASSQRPSPRHGAGSGELLHPSSQLAAILRRVALPASARSMVTGCTRLVSDWLAHRALSASLNLDANGIVAAAESIAAGRPIRHLRGLAFAVCGLGGNADLQLTAINCQSEITVSRSPDPFSASRLLGAPTAGQWPWPRLPRPGLDEQLGKVR